MTDALKVLKLKRICEIESGTFGVLFFEDIPFCLTVERRWFSNKKGESCIPAGEYICKPFDSQKFGATWEVTEVPWRDAILFHKGNVQDDSHGCIIVAEKFGVLNNQTAILSSGEAFSEFLEKVRGEKTFKLVVVSI